MVGISFEKERQMKEFFKNLHDVFKALTKFQFMRFCVTGSLGVITDAVIYHIFLLLLNVDLNKATRTTTDTILLFILPVFGYLAAVIQNYLVNHLWTFGKETENHRVSFQLFIKFFAVSLFSLIPRYAFYTFLLIFNNITPDLANLGGIAAGMFTNFFGSKFVVFRFRDEAPKRIEEHKEASEEEK